MGTGKRINSERVKALRTKRGISQKVFAGMIGVTAGNVSRWECGVVDRVRRDTLGKMCSVLAVAEADICDDGPLSTPPPASPQKGQMNLSIGIRSRNALSLAASRYGVTRQQIVEAAPLLFVIVAEASLRRRHERVEKARAAAKTVWDAVEAAQAAAPEHVFLSSLEDEWEDSFEDEEQSIASRDLFSTAFAAKAEDTPFARFLSALLSHDDPAAPSVLWASGSTPEYRICPEEAEKLVGPDKEAIDAILGGAVALHQMPREIRNALPAERAQWVLAEGRVGDALPDLGDFSPAEIKPPSSDEIPL